MNEIKEYIKDKKNLKFIGSGQFGSVYKLEYQRKEYAIKKISKEKIDYNKDVDSEYMKKALKREIEILKECLNMKIQSNFTIISRRKKNIYWF